MKVKTHNAALNLTLKAEDKKAMKDQPTASRKITQPKHQAAKPAGTAKSVKKTAVATKKSPLQKAVTSKKSKIKKPKQKVVRHSFSMPENEYNMIGALKERLVKAGIAVKKSDILRAGIKGLLELSHSDLNKKMSKLYPNV